jgi:hypothetical protein
LNGEPEFLEATKGLMDIPARRRQVDRHLTGVDVLLGIGGVADVKE